MRRALIIGGTGLVGRAAARRLLAGGWRVGVFARGRSEVPADLVDAGADVSFGDRSDPAQLRRAVGGGVDLVVDCACYTAAHARGLLELLTDVSAAVMISTKAVYVDGQGRDVNSAARPVFTEAVRESQPTLAPDASPDYDSPRYGACKVAAEQVLLDSGRPVSVLRAGKVHGDGARRPREWVFVKRVLDRRGVLLLAGGGRGGDHPCAAVNLAALVELAAGKPGRRVLNAADPDTPDGLAIARTVAAAFGHEWTEVELDDTAPPGLGAHPWDHRPPMRLDLSAALALGYQPAGGYAETVAPTLRWLRGVARRTSAGAVLPGGYDNEYFARMVDYQAEDAYLDRAHLPPSG